MTMQALNRQMAPASASSDEPAAELNPWADILRPLLTALRWKGDERHIVDAMAVGIVSADGESFRELIANLGYASKLRRIRPRDLDTAWLPAVAINRHGKPRLLSSESDLQIDDRAERTVLLFESRAEPAAAGPEPSTLSDLFGRFQPILSQVLVISLFIGILALAPTFYNRAIYDDIIGTSSATSLPMFLFGALLALLAEIALRHLRSRQLSYFGARIDHFVSCSVFERLMFLPPAYTERATVSSQVARLRDFESVREFFTGPLASLFFEMPLVVVYLIAVAIVGSWLAAIPIVLVVAYIILFIVTKQKMQGLSKASSIASSARHGLLLESIAKIRGLRLDGLEETWLRRYEELATKATLASFRASNTAQVLEVLSYMLMTLGGVATLGFGVFAVIHQFLTTGDLIATMMLIWRILTPLQLCCSSVTRLQQLSASTEQVRRLLSIPTERDPHLPAQPLLSIAGAVSYRRISLRYGPDMPPALLGVNFDIRPGQVVAIAGANGSGKSSLLKLIMGLYVPQAGSVLLDGVDIRQMDPTALRQTIAYAPQMPSFMPGTIRENLLLAEPAATEEMLNEALYIAAASEEVGMLPQGIDTAIAGDGAERISVLLEHRINLARCWLRQARLALFDEMPFLPDENNTDSFAALVEKLRGQATIILVTRREDHMRLADVLLYLADGELTHAGPPNRVLQALREKRK